LPDYVRELKHALRKVTCATGVYEMFIGGIVNEREENREEEKATTLGTPAKKQ
jgi:hypothetical protein